jgi:hypothetical protein
MVNLRRLSWIVMLCAALMSTGESEHPGLGEAACSSQFGGPQRPVAYEPGAILPALGITSEEYVAFREGVASIEDAYYAQMGGAKKKYAGRYQLGAREIDETAAALNQPGPTAQEFLSNPELQESYFEAYTLAHHKILMGNPLYANASVETKLQILARAHNEGATGASNWLISGVVHLDAFGTNPKIYADAVRDRLTALKAQTCLGIPGGTESHSRIASTQRHRRPIVPKGLSFIAPPSVNAEVSQPHGRMR